MNFNMLDNRKDLTKNKFLGNKLEIFQFSNGYRGNMDSVLVALNLLKIMFWRQRSAALLSISIPTTSKSLIRYNKQHNATPFPEPNSNTL